MQEQIAASSAPTDLTKTERPPTQKYEIIGLINLDNIITMVIDAQIIRK